MVLDDHDAQPIVELRRKDAAVARTTDVRCATTNIAFADPQDVKRVRGWDFKSSRRERSKPETRSCWLLRAPSV